MVFIVIYYTEINDPEEIITVNTIRKDYQNVKKKLAT